MTGIDPSELRVGMEVVGSDGAFIGHVREVRDQYLSTDRAAKPDVYVPFSEIERVAEGNVVVRVPGQEIDLMGWSKIPVP
jgi:hypothetical protein